MSILKPTPIVPQAARALCPICGKASYSRDGIHPQCSLAQADAVRYEKVLQVRRQEPKPVKVKNRHLSKSCPKCAANMHVRVKKCTCGHLFE